MPKVTQQHRDARRQQIIGAALRCMVGEGFHKTTMADVITEAGLSAGAVYGYFKSKNDLIRAISEIAIGEASDLLEVRAADPEPITPEEALTLLLRSIEDRSKGPNGDLTRVGIQAWSEALRDPLVHAIVSGRMQQLRSAFEAVCRRAKAEGLLPRSARPREVAQVLQGMVTGYIVQRHILGDVTPASYIRGLSSLRQL